MNIKSIIAICAACFVLGIVSFVLLINLLSSIRRKKRRKNGEPRSTRGAAGGSKKKSLADHFGGTMNLILIIIFVVLTAFTCEMIELFKIYGSVPDTLINCVFLALTGECGCLGWIKTTKDKYREREWQEEERKRNRREAKEDAKEAAKASSAPETDYPTNNL